MGKQYRIEGLMCPHCGEKNSFVASLPLYGHKDHTTTCWNSEEEKGCMKKFVVRQIVQTVTDFTPDQQRSRQENSISFKL